MRPSYFKNNCSIIYIQNIINLYYTDNNGKLIFDNLFGMTYDPLYGDPPFLSIDRW